MNWLGRLLVWMSGADYDVLSRYRHEKAKYVGAGSGILITGIIAGLSMWFALTSALGTQVPVATALAACWALVIMSIDRWLVVSMKRQPGYKLGRYIRAAAPRLFLAAVLGFVISTPITLRVFQKEIDFQLGRMQDSARAAFLKSPARVKLENALAAEKARAASLAQGGLGTGTADSKLTELNAKLAADKAQANQDFNRWQCELYGIPMPDGTKCPDIGPGPVEAQAEKAYKADRAAVNQDRDAIKQEQSDLGAADSKALPAAGRQVALDQSELNSQLAAFNAQDAANTGLLERINALDAASAKRPDLAIARWLLFLLFFLVDCLPALMAITHVRNPPDEYEEAIAQGIATRKAISQQHLDDLAEDAKALSLEREQRRAGTARAQADAEQRVRLHDTSRWEESQGRQSRRRATRRAAAGPGRTRQGTASQGMPPGQGRPQVFIRQFRPPHGIGSQNGQVPGNGSAGGVS
jgi:hypothetical protein